MVDGNQKIELGEHPVSNWLSLFPFAKKEENFRSLIDKITSGIHPHATTPELVTAINQTAFTSECSVSERRFLMKVKDWIFQGAVLHDLNDRVDFTSRLQYADNSKLSDRNPQTFIKGVETWDGAQSGVYTNQLVMGVEAPTSSHARSVLEIRQLNPIERPGTVEHFIAHRINQLLDDKNHQQPVVVMDFGGMQSLSFLRLAEHFRSAVKSGKVVFVVTNLAAGKEQIRLNIQRKWQSYPREYPWITRAFELVNYIQADASEAHNTTISTPTDDVHLAGNVDLIHESNALTAHGLVNEQDFPLLGQLLSADGILMSSRVGVDSHCPIDGSVLENPQIRRFYRTEKAFKSIHGPVETKINSVFKSLDPQHDQARLAVQGLLRQGLKMIELVKDKQNLSHLLRYVLFARPQISDLTFFDELGGDYRFDNIHEWNRFALKAVK